MKFGQIIIIAAFVANSIVKHPESYLYIILLAIAIGFAEILIEFGKRKNEAVSKEIKPRS